MKVKLLITIGGKPKKTLLIQDKEVIFGRARGNTIRVPSPAISRKHCRLTVVDQQVFIEDLNSRNGTLVNNQSVEGIQEIQSGDRLELGPVLFEVQFNPREKDEPGDEPILLEMEPEENEDTEEEPILLETEPEVDLPSEKPGTSSNSTKKTLNLKSVPPKESLSPRASVEKSEQPVKKTPISKQKSEKPESKEKPPIDLDSTWNTSNPGSLTDLLKGLEDGELLDDDEE